MVVFGHEKARVKWQEVVPKDWIWQLFVDREIMIR